jgi:hypothetical protein
MYTVYYTGEFVPVERDVRKLDRIVDVWLRRNPRTDSDGMNMADEIHLTFPADAAPTFDELSAHIDDYFLADSMPETTLEDVMDAINMLTDIVLGGGE